MQRIVPTVFNDKTHEKLPSISSREEGDRRPDSKTEKSNAKFAANHPELFVLMTYMESQILHDKPTDIVDYLKFFFSPANEESVKQALHLTASKTSGNIEDDIKAIVIKPSGKSSRR
jgi:hypothetical protein